MDATTFINELNATTLKRIYPARVRDFYFRSSALLAHIRANGRVMPWNGGLYEDQPFLYRPLVGGAFTKGQPFSTVKVETTAANRFDANRKYYTNVTEFLEDIYIVNRGPAAIVNRVGLDMRAMVNTINEFIAIDMWRHGQGIAGGTTGSTTTDRSAYINGLAEAINDGATPGWTGEFFQSYGQIDRTSTGPYSSGYKPFRSVPKWCGDPSGNPGRLDYLKLMMGYEDATVGNMEPDLGICNRAVFAHLMNTIQPQQRIETVMDYSWGVTGVKFRNAVIVKDEYCPSVRYGESRSTGSFLPVSFTTPSSGMNAQSGFPSNTLVNPAGTFWFLNTNSFRFVMPDGPYGMAFSGFQKAFNADIIAGQTLMAGTLICDDPRLNKQFLGILEDD